MKKLVLVLSLLVVVFSLCAWQSPDQPYDVAVIIKATDSDFWQYVLVGAENFRKE